jgi:hypothetical protein
MEAPCELAEPLLAGWWFRTSKLAAPETVKPV